MSLKQFVKNLYLNIKHRETKVKISKNAVVAISSHFEGYNRIGRLSHFSGLMGYGSYMTDGCSIHARIGRFCSLGSNIRTVKGVHPTSGFVSTHPAFYSIMKQNGISYVHENLFDEQKYADKAERIIVDIGNDVWIGDNALIMAGIHIGNGAVVAAGAVVTKDVEPYAIVGGCPAKVIRKRFDDQTIEALLSDPWWDKPISWIEANAGLFCNVEQFVNREKERKL